MRPGCTKPTAALSAYAKILLPILIAQPCTGVKLLIGSKDQCMFHFEICIPEGRGGEKGGSANFKAKHTESLTPEIPSALYCSPEGEEREGVQISKQSTQDL